MRLTLQGNKTTPAKNVLAGKADSLILNIYNIFELYVCITRVVNNVINKRSDQTFRVSNGSDWIILLVFVCGGVSLIELIIMNECQYNYYANQMRMRQPRHLQGWWWWSRRWKIDRLENAKTYVGACDWEWGDDHQ